MNRWLPLIVALPLYAQQGQPPVFRSDVRLVRLLATVKDGAGTPVGSLTRNDFRIFDNNVEQQVAVFEQTTERPLSVSVLVDISASTAKDLKYEVESVNRFFRALFSSGNPEDRAALYTFNYEVRLLRNFTRRHEALESSLRGLKAEAGTSLYDAMYLAAGDLGERDGRHVMIIVTDGGDTTSYKDFHAALEAAQIAEAVVYPILVMPITNEAGRNIGGENALTTIANATGGRVFAPSLGVQLDSAFNEILRDLRTQYLIGFYPKNIPPTKNRFHQLKLKVADTGLRVQTRSGYYGDSTP